MSANSSEGFPDFTATISDVAPRGARRLVFLGTGTSVGVPMIGCDCRVCQSPDPKLKRTRPSVLIHSPAGRVLIDTTPEMRIQLLREKIPFAHAILFTHHHADHVFGLDDIRIFSRFLEGDVPVYCEPKTEDFIRQAFRYAFDPRVLAFPAGGVPKIRFHRIDRPEFRILDHVVTPIPLQHGIYDVLGFRFDNLAYCTDTNHIPDASMALLRDLDVLILDALRPEPHPTHFCLQEALEVVEILKPKRAVFTHMSCRMDPELIADQLPPHVELAHDGLAIDF